MSSRPELPGVVSANATIFAKNASEEPHNKAAASLVTRIFIIVVSTDGARHRRPVSAPNNRTAELCQPSYWCPPALKGKGLHALRQCPLSAAATSRHRLAYSITSSALASNVAGTVRPRARAVRRLIASWNLVGCSTGRRSARLMDAG